MRKTNHIKKSVHWNPHSILNVQTMKVYSEILINRYYLFHLILVIVFSQKMLCTAHTTRQPYFCMMLMSVLYTLTWCVC